jgi:uncharacterized protein (DUF342 family)
MGDLGGKGLIVGGNVQALEKVQARIIGSSSEIITGIAVGPPKGLLARIEKIKRDIDQVRKDLIKFGRPVQSEPEPFAGSPDSRDCSSKQIALIEKLQSLEAEAEELQDKLNSPGKGLIKAAEVYRGAILRVGALRKTVEDCTSDFYLYEPD